MKSKAHYKFSEIETIRDLLARQWQSDRAAFVMRYAMAHNGEQPSDELINLNVFLLPAAIKAANNRYVKFYGLRGKYSPHQGNAECARRRGN